MKILVVISGKGGTGKTSVTAAFARLASGAVVADCDVDAADLHLVLLSASSKQHKRHEFSARKRAFIDAQACTRCGLCVAHCRFAAISVDPPRVDPTACEGCGLCARVCPRGAAGLESVVSGVWSVDETPWGPLVHAQLGVAEDNSGKLVSLVRREAEGVAQERSLDTVLVDGAPGVGCPVIASLAGASMALVVSEPMLAARHDLGRVVDLAAHLRLPWALCVNKADLNGTLAGEMAREAAARGARFAMRVCYDRAVTAAMVGGGSVVDEAWAMGSVGAADDLRALWHRTNQELEKLQGEDGDE